MVEAWQNPQISSPDNPLQKYPPVGKVKINSDWGFQKLFQERSRSVFSQTSFAELEVATKIAIPRISNKSRFSSLDHSPVRWVGLV